MPFRVLLTFSLLYYTKLIKQYPYPNEQISFSGVRLSIDACSFLPDRCEAVHRCLQFPSRQAMLLLACHQCHQRPCCTSMLLPACHQLQQCPCGSWIVSNNINVPAVPQCYFQLVINFSNAHAVLDCQQCHQRPCCLWIVINLNAAPSFQTDNAASGLSATPSTSLLPLDCHQPQYCSMLFFNYLKVLT